MNNKNPDHHEDRPKVLVLEESYYARLLLGVIHETEAYNTLTAEDSNVGLETALNETQHSLSLDLVMPHMDGLAML